ncbi:MAG TPA: hypothetical protein VGJ15_00295, partial [Pirellulales bacterium]
MILNSPTQAACATPSEYRRWSAQVQALAEDVAELEPTAAELGLPDVAQSVWHGELFHKLLPQVRQPPFLICAVAGGTNTGKSVVFNHLAGSAASRAHPNATQTRHPVCIVPREFSARSSLAQLFPDFHLLPWTNENDPLAATDENLLFVRDDSSGRQSPRLLLLDT